MVRNSYAYFLTVTDFNEDFNALSSLLNNDEYFAGALTYSDTIDGGIVFDLDKVGGSIDEIDSDNIDNAMYLLSKKFP